MTDHVDPHDETPSAPFRRVLSLIDGLPERFKPSDDTPLREAMPGGWPTIGEFRAFMVSYVIAKDVEIDRLRKALTEISETEPFGHFGFRGPKHSGYTALEIARAALSSAEVDHAD